jgi:SAM-dependent methyltransferase
MNYIHGYSDTEADRLTSQATFWRERLILPGTRLAPGTRLLEIGCGIGAILGILHGAFPGLVLSGVDIEPAQITTARRRLGRAGIQADLRAADGRALPFAGGSFDHVWIQFVLEHMDVDGARRTLQEARRVLVPGGRLTAIEVDYRTLRLTPDLGGLAERLSGAMDAYGLNDAGARMRTWLNDGGWSDANPGAHHLSYHGEAAAPMATYLADVMEASLPDVSTEALRKVGRRPQDSIECTLYKSTARA